MKIVGVAILAALAAASSAQTYVTTALGMALESPGSSLATLIDQLGTLPAVGQPVTTLSMTDTILSGGSGIEGVSEYGGVVSGGDVAGRAVILGSVLAPASLSGSYTNGFALEVENSTTKIVYPYSKTNFSGQATFIEGALNKDILAIVQQVNGATGDSLIGQYQILPAPAITTTYPLETAWTNLHGAVGDGTLISFYLIPNTLLRNFAGHGKFSAPSPYRDDLMVTGVLNVGGAPVAGFSQDLGYAANTTNVTIPIGPSHTAELQNITNTFGIGSKVTLSFVFTITLNAYDYTGAKIYTGTYFTETLSQQCVVTARR